MIESDFSILKVWFVVPGFFLFNTDHNFISSFLVGKKQFLEKTLAREMSNFVSNSVLPAGLWWEPGEVHLGGWGGGRGDEQICLLSIFMTHYHKFPKIFPSHRWLYRFWKRELNHLLHGSIKRWAKIHAESAFILLCLMGSLGKCSACGKWINWERDLPRS